jgi:hypothetical protein
MRNRKQLKQTNNDNIPMQFVNNVNINSSINKDLNNNK